ncbi:glycosyltransferase family 2 protein [Marivirga sp. S37H4]|uniref:Glycosyltransferase family 2 protein n=1 Tax=Marivirga aurantiaca TaxID=2802615 RepID=A0A934WVA5_9BACT|nr:cellulose synthase family protein [Marivirga aurantiaca]MBK6263627.1 glycosyltransferase family 2 protein [Marivirga aurantiaca]
MNWEWIIIAVYSISLLFIFFFSLGQLHLTWHYLRAKKQAKNEHIDPKAKIPDNWPKVCVQLPVYNERYVVSGLVDKVCQLDYPSDLLQIQVLDDSTDDTTEILTEKINSWKAKGVNIELIRRPDRKGFKAGALQYGMEASDAEFIAIFDADFLPDSNFLKTTIPQFQHPGVGVVQTRWGHVNKDYSLLTKLQAFGLDAHFTIEQVGRSHAGSFINFNGTAGVWRKETIIDAGGWSADTLTEDLDLSYRAQLKGWKFLYREDVESPAELPIIMPAIKSQQFRWNKGGAETARKNFGKVLRSNIGLSNKIHAFFHLFNSSIFIAILITALLSIPMLYIKSIHPELLVLFQIGSVFLVGFFSIAIFYWVANKYLIPEKHGWYFIRTFPVFITVSMGLSLHNALAVAEGLLGFKSDFIRTPKFNLSQKGESWKTNKYIKLQFSWLSMLEALLAVYFAFGIFLGFHLKDYGLIIFHFMLMMGFMMVFFHSVKPGMK